MRIKNEFFVRCLVFGVGSVRAGDLAALGADIASANNGGSATPRNKATWAAVLLSAGGLLYNMQKKNRLLHNL